MSRLLAVLAMLLSAGAAWAGTFAVPGGEYMAIAPPGWDGRAALPVLMFLHGSGDSPEAVLGDAMIPEAAAKAGVLLVLPTGENHSWHFVNSRRAGRDDFAFLHAVLADVRARFPVDPRRVVASGFSVGASMVWALACWHDEGIGAFLAISGTLWQPFPESCPAPPVPLRQVHGTADATFPLAGRTTRFGGQQGDTRAALALLRQGRGCRAEPRRFADPSGLACEAWEGCVTVQLCLHDGGHGLDAAKFAASLDWALHASQDRRQ